MAQPQYSLTWDAYQTTICGGFSALQQNGEMVDMTLAADGHIVKVHQILMALASPFLKELINSAPCKHPVIFLNNVSHKTLCYLLEYVYTGEVLIPASQFPAFLRTSKELHIRGLENVIPAENIQNVTVSVENNVPASSARQITLATASPQQIGLPPRARKIHVKNANTGAILSSPQEDESFTYSDSAPMDDSRNYSDEEDDVKPTSCYSNKDLMSQMPSEKSSVNNLQFTVSNRGSLQVILNRYLYNLVSTQSRNGMRRWRCVDYRTSRCPAFVVTKGNIVCNRSNLHNHQFHDKKILSKIERKVVYTALDEVEGKAIKDKEGTEKDIQAESMDTETPMEEEVVHSTRSMLEIPGVKQNV